MNSMPARNDESWPGNRPRYGGDTPDSGDMDDTDAADIDLYAFDDQEALVPGFDEVPLETVASNVTDESVYDALAPEESDPAYFARVDPVLTTDEHDDVQVLNGWAPSSLSPEEQADRSVEGPQPGDEAVASQVAGVRDVRDEVDVQVMD